MRALVLFTLLACGQTPFSPQSAPDKPRPQVGPVPGSTLCIDLDSSEVGLWAVDCTPRCLPPKQLSIVCHAAGPPHVYGNVDDEELIPTLPVRLSAAASRCRGEASWDVFTIKPEPLRTDQIDGGAGASWPGLTLAECPPAEVPLHAETDWINSRPYNVYWLLDEGPRAE